MRLEYTLNGKAMEAAKKLYDYIGFCGYSDEELTETIENDLGHGYLTDHDGKDGKYYLWYVDDEAHESVAICVDTGEILTDEKEICDIVGIDY